MELISDPVLCCQKQVILKNQDGNQTEKSMIKQLNFLLW